MSSPVAPDMRSVQAFTKTGLRLGGSRREELSRFLAARFLSENAAAIESRACRVLSSGSRRAPVTRVGCLIGETPARQLLSCLHTHFARDLASISRYLFFSAPLPSSPHRFLDPSYSSLVLIIDLPPPHLPSSPLHA